MPEIPAGWAAVALAIVAGLPATYAYLRGQQADRQSGYSGLLDRLNAEAASLHTDLAGERALRNIAQQAQATAERRAADAEQRLAACLETLEP